MTLVTFLRSLLDRAGDINLVVGQRTYPLDSPGVPPRKAAAYFKTQITRFCALAQPSLAKGEGACTDVPKED